MKNKLSVIILSWNTKKVLRDCLLSLIKELKRLGEASEVIIVDNHSTDNSVAMVKKEFPQVKLIINSQNLGFSAGNNQGLRVAQGELIMLLNSDTLVERGSIKKMARFFAEHEEVGAASPLLMLPNGKKQLDYYMRFPSLWQIVFYHNRFLRFISMRTPLRWLIVSKTRRRRPFFVDQLPGAALLARKKVWDKVGGLDEDYVFFYEDVDWCWRAQKAGFRLMVIPQARITHLGGESWKQKVRADSFGFYQRYFDSMLIFIRKNYGWVMGVVFRLALITNFLLRFKFKLAWAFFVRKKIVNPLWQS